jgi:hypothetical protein
MKIHNENLPQQYLAHYLILFLTGFTVNICGANQFSFSFSME